ncbi:hypothetical protein [uncultured Roseovarius sp.]|uniref:hypothetical protein n=1 Tax=uncultured Roseovarius sp. TaxID=293344 RepID=UPI002624BF3A|nr:hypothetical protein [uncultured Roseovarius sp.]
MARADPEKIEAARAYAEKEVKRFLASELPRGEGRGPAAYYLWWHLNLSFAKGARGSFIRVSDDAAAVLCNAALANADVRDLVLDIIATRIMNDMLLTDVLKDFAVAALLDRLPKPKTKRGPKVSDRFERDMFIIWTLEAIEWKFGVPPTENDMRSGALPPSGMGILAKCFADAGRHEVTARAVKDVWLDEKKRQNAKMIIAAILSYEKPPVNCLADMIAGVGN